MIIIDPFGRERDIVNEMIAVSAKWRGTIIDKTIFLERCIDAYIAIYFCGKEGEKSNELVELILSTDRMIFMNKLAVLKFLIDKYYKEFKEEFPNYNTEIVKIIEMRNIFAHYLLNTTADAVKKYTEQNIIGYIKYRNLIQLVDFHIEQLENTQKTIEKYMSAFRKEVMKP